MTTANEKRSRDTRSDLPSDVSADRPSGTYEGDESVPQHGEPAQPDFETGFTTEKPRDVKPAIPPYEGRKTVADSGETGDEAGARTAGATAPTTDPDYKSPPRTTHRVGRRHRRRKSNPPPVAVKPIATTTWSGLRSRRAPGAANTNASDSHLVPRHIEVGAQRTRHPAVPRRLRWPERPKEPFR
jgi:hypothetical protein